MDTPTHTTPPPTENGVSPGTGPLPADIPRYLLQFLLSCQGVCHEYVLLSALVHIGRDMSLPEQDAAQWHQALRTHMEAVNVNLEPLQYRVVLVNHGLGKRAATATLPRTLGLDLGLDLGPLPDSGRFYVYVNTHSSTETRLATTLTPQQVEFTKWAVAQCCEQGGAVQTLSPQVAQASRQLRQDLSGSGSGTGTEWSLYASYSVGSTHLAQYPGLSAIEVEQLLAQLCERKWFARTADGRVGLDLRAATELDELLRETYGLPVCAVCSQVVLHGAACGNLAAHTPEEEEEDEGEGEGGESTGGMTMWHVDCYQHYVAHVSKECPKCSASIVDNAVYVL